MAQTTRDREGQWRRALLAWARRQSRRGAEAEDLLQEALLATLEAGRWRGDGASLAYTAGAVRQLALHTARSAARRQAREAQYAWHVQAVHGAGDADPECSQEHGLQGLGPALRSLPTSLRLLALLVLSGHTREEAAWLLRIPDTALRQRLVALKKRLRAAGVSGPSEFAALQAGRPGLPFGRVRQALLPALRRTGAHLGAHDPDGRPLLLGVRPLITAPTARVAGALPVPEQAELTNAGGMATSLGRPETVAPVNPGALP